MALYVAFFRFKEGMGLVEGMQAFERRKQFTHPPRATVAAEFWVNAPPGFPQVVLAWEAEDEGPGDYYEAAWGDLFDITIAPATRPVSELPADLGSLAAD
jgi:hypothetical protein